MCVYTSLRFSSEFILHFLVEICIMKAQPFENHAKHAKQNWYFIEMYDTTVTSNSLCTVKRLCS